MDWSLGAQMLRLYLKVCDGTDSALLVRDTSFDEYEQDGASVVFTWTMKRSQEHRTICKVQVSSPSVSSAIQVHQGHGKRGGHGWVYVSIPRSGRRFEQARRKN